MSLYVIADLHLSLSAGKPMDVFSGWDDYIGRLAEHWNANISEHDIVVLPGDISWGMDLKQSEKDFAFLDSLPGNKIIIKGNHDYWFSTKNKTEKFWAQQGFSSLKMLFNNAFFYKDYAIAGSRGWINETGEAPDKKVLLREAGRLRLSLQAAERKEPLVFLHYPPVFQNDVCREVMDVLLEYNVKRVFYGHLHGRACSNAVEGERDGIKYTLVSADHLGFCPLKIMD